MADKIYQLEKDIPIVGGKSFKKGTRVYDIHGLYYLDEGMLPNDYQEDFRQLIENESKNGWNYIVPIKIKEKHY